jgi:hypothetical protein
LKFAVSLDGFSYFGIWFSPPRLTQKVSDLPPDVVALVNLLFLERVEDLGMALLDFDSVDDLVGNRLTIWGF